MKVSVKRFLGCVAAFSALPFAISSIAFPASAAMVTPDPASIAGWLGKDITCQYLTSSGTYKRDTLHLFTGTSFQDVQSGTWTGITHQYSQSPYDLIGTKVVWYYFSPPQDMATPNSNYTSPLILANWDIYFSDCSYLEAFTSSYVHPDAYNVRKYSEQKPYNYTELGSDLSLSSSYNYIYSQPSPWQNTTAWHSGSGVFSNVFISGGSYSGVSSTVYIGWASCSGLMTYNGLYVVGFSIPLLNDDAVYRGHTSQIYKASGTVSGNVSEDSGGGYNVDYNITVDIPDYSAAINPSYDSSRLDEMGGDIEDYHSAESSLLDAANDGLSSVPDLELDSEMIEDAYNPLQSFFGINIVGIMVFWVGAIAFISYILFGKWV